MAQKKVGALIKEARTAAGLTQEKLAKAAGEKLTAADISKCEQGKADLTTAQLKAVAKACGVTQTSLVNAPKNLTDTAGKSNTAGKKATEKTAAAKTTAAKTTAAKTTAAKTQTAKTAAAKKDEAKKTGVKETAAKTQTAKTAAKENAAKKTAAKTQAAKTAAAKKPAAPAGANTSMKVTATEKKLIEAYRDAPADLKKAALKVLKGEYGETVNNLLGASSGAGATAADGVGEILGNLLGGILGGK